MRAQGWAEAEKAKAQRNLAAMREHGQILGQAPRHNSRRIEFQHGLNAAVADPFRLWAAGGSFSSAAVWPPARDAVSMGRVGCGDAANVFKKWSANAAPPGVRTTQVVGSKK